jgi:hypothetical protein
MNYATGSHFDTFRATITGIGHTIVPLTSFNAADFVGLDALILMQPFNSNPSFSASEIADIQAFAQNAVFLSDSSLWADSHTPCDRPITFGNNQLLLQNAVNYAVNGHGIIVTADNGGGFNVTNINTLVAPYGIQFSSSPTEGNGHTITGFVPHPVTTGLQAIGVDFQLRITTNSPSIDLTIGSGADNALSAWALEYITLSLDIKPGSCPNPLNTNTQGKGRLPMAILGTDDFDVSDIDPASISIAGTVFPQKTPSIEDVSAPLLDNNHVNVQPPNGVRCECHEEGPDGYADLVIHFSRREIIAALGLGALARDTEVPITVTGELLDGTPFEATDCVRIIARKD